MELKENLQKRVEEFKNTYPVEEQAKSRVTRPSMAFYGTEILNRAVTALLEGENLLLCGDKATGKNVLAENLAWIFGRPVYDISFHVNTDSSSLIGTDTFVDNEVKLREGPIYQCARWAASGSWTRSIWRKATQFPYSIRCWISAGPWTYPGMTGFPFTLPPDLSQP